MSCKVRGGLKSGDRVGASKKKVHFIDEVNVSIYVGDLEEQRLQTQGIACSFARKAPSLDEVLANAAISCDANAQAVGNLMQKGGNLREESCHVMPDAVKESKKAAHLCGVEYDNCLIKNDSPSTPPHDLASRNAEPQSQIHANSHVQRKLTFGVASSHRKYGLTNKSNLSRSHSYYKVVPEVEEGALPMNFLKPLHGLNNLQMQQASGLFSEDVCKKRCAWITPQSDPVYVAYHDEEWGVPVHEDRRLFELLVFAGAQAEGAWSTLLAKREAHRNIFAQFDPSILATYDSSKAASLRSHNDILRSEARVESILSNAKLVMKIVEEYGSFDAYLWGFVSNRPIVNKYRQAKLIPVRTGKSEAISKDLQRRGFRHAGPIVIYSLMQAAGLANDHLLSCFCHHALLLLPPPPLCSSSPHPLFRKPAPARKPLESPLCC